MREYRLMIIVVLILAFGVGYYGWLSRKTEVIEPGTYVIYQSRQLVSLGSDFFPHWSSDLFYWKIGSDEAPVYVTSRQEEPTMGECDWVPGWFDGTDLDQKNGLILQPFRSSQNQCQPMYQAYRLDGSSFVKPIPDFEPTWTSKDGSMSITQNNTSLSSDQDFGIRITDRDGTVSEHGVRLCQMPPGGMGVDGPSGIHFVSDDGERIYMGCQGVLYRYEWRTSSLAPLTVINDYQMTINSINEPQEKAIGWSDHFYLVDFRTGTALDIGDAWRFPVDDQNQPHLSPDGTEYFFANRIVQFGQVVDHAPHTISGTFLDWVDDWLILDRGNELTAYHVKDKSIVHLGRNVGGELDPDVVVSSYIGTLTVSE